MIKQVEIKNAMESGLCIVDVVAVSAFSGKTSKMEMCLDLDDLDMWRHGEKAIQNAMPYLTADQREFLMTGVTPEEWEKAFG